MTVTRLLVWTLLGLATAHPDGHLLQPSYRSLAHCKAHFDHADFKRQTVTRRHAEVRRIKQARGLEDVPILSRRQLSKFLFDHEVHKAFDESTAPEELFAEDGNCMLSPLVSEGPLYVSGEQVRRDLTDNETGVPLTLEFQVVNAKTCEPMKKVAVDIWSCNTTGLYSGVWTYAHLSPEEKENYDRSIINSTALRGIQLTDDEGVATFDTFFPGHYEGRAVHIHAMVHTDVTVYPNDTISAGAIPHIAQIYFDQSLITAVEKIPPYTLNNQNLTLNTKDGLLRMTTTSGPGHDADPFMRYVMLGEKLEDGLFAYMRLGVDVSSDWSVSPAAFREQEGGRQNLDGPMGDGSQPPKIPPNPGGN